MMKKCVLCKSAEYKKLFDIEQFSLLKCKKCGLVKTKGQQTISYHDYHRDKVYKSFEKLFKNIYQKRVAIILRFKKRPGRVLDIGTSTGTMLEIFKNAGWEVWGVEPSENAKVARKRGIKILRTTFENLSAGRQGRLPKSYFDVVILNHTLEHMENPIAVLKKAKTLLKNKGIILVDVPNFGGLSAKILGKRWLFILPNEHLFHFTPKTLRKALEKTGFKVVHWQTQSGIFECADPLFEIFYSLITFKKRFFTNILGLPGALIATLVNGGASLSMIGQKK